MKALVTYSFNDDDVRDGFEQFLIARGLVNEADQTTYALPDNAKIGLKTLYDHIIKLLSEFEFEEGEHVTMYWTDSKNIGRIAKHCWS